MPRLTLFEGNINLSFSFQYLKEGKIHDEERRPVLPKVSAPADHRRFFYDVSLVNLKNGNKTQSIELTKVKLPYTYLIF